MPPPIPFPYPLHIGTDICRVARIAHILRSKQAARFIRRVLAPEELARAKPALRQVLEQAAAGQAGRREGGGLAPRAEGGVQVRPGRGQSVVGRERGRDAVRLVREGGKGNGSVGLSGRGEGKVGEEEEAGGEEAVVFERAATYLAGRWVWR